MSHLDIIQELYDRSGPVHDAGDLPLAEYHRAMLTKTGVAPRFADQSASTKFLRDHPGEGDALLRWMRSEAHYEIYIVPVDDLNGDVHGWFLRSAQNRGFYVDYDTCAFMAGLWAFDGFQYGQTIVIVEGIKDALAVQQFYPYCLASMTASVTQNTLAVIGSMTRSVLVIGDNDIGGRTLVKRFRTAGFSLKQGRLPVKDPGMYWENRPLVEPYLKMIPLLCRR